MRAVVAAFAACACLAACTRVTQTKPTGNELIIAQLQEPRSLNPLYLDGYVGGEINGLVYSFLTTYDGSGRIVPQVAASVPTLSNGGISRDGRRVTYHLRHDVRWQDGAPLTARDVAFSFEAIMKPQNATLSRYGYDAIASVHAVDTYTVRVDLHKPFAAIVPYFFGGDSNYGILPAHLLARYPSLNAVAFNGMPVGSGPYRVADWMRGDHITFEANPTFFLGKPAIARIVIKFVPDTQTIVNQLRTGEVNADFFADVSHIDEVRSIPAHRLVESATTQFGTLQIDTEDPLMREPAVRRALAMAIDRHAITEKIFKGVYAADTAMQSLFTWAYDPTAGTIPFDPARAERLLTDHGWRLDSDGIRYRDGKALSATLLEISGSAASSSVANLIAAEAARIGMRLTMKAVTPLLITSPSGPLYRGRFQVAQFTEQSSVDPDVAWIVGCDQRAPHGFNFTRYCDRTTQRLLDDASSAVDRARRLHDYAQVQRRLLAAVPMIFLYQVKELDAIPDNLRGYSQSMYTSPYTSVYRWTLR